jgi:hypothetical protein
MKKTLTTAAAALVVGALGLTACGEDVDRIGTRNRYIKTIEDEFGGTADGECIDQVLDQYSDDELKAKADGGADATSTQLDAELIACTSLAD